jgi:hypothetical protein
MIQVLKNRLDILEDLLPTQYRVGTSILDHWMKL